MLNFKKERVTNDQLGGGASGTVFVYRKDETDQRFVAKMISPKTFEGLSEVFREITLGFSCDNPYVLPVKGYLIEQKGDGGWRAYIKLPRMQKSLKDILDDHKRNKKLMPEMEIAQHFYEIACGLQYLHGKSIANRDIKPANILFDDSNTSKIADFGIGDLSEESIIMQSSAKGAGTEYYMAPENHNKDLHKKDFFAADLWSLGMVIFELCTQTDLGSLKLDFREKLEEIKEKLQELEKEKKYSTMLINLISGLLKLEPTERKNPRDVCEELISNYGKQLKMNYSSKDLGNSHKDLKDRLQELEKKLEEKDAYIQEREKHYKDIVADLESQIEMNNLAYSQKMGRSNVKDYKEEPVDQEQTQKSLQQLKLFVKEFEAKNNGIFAIKQEAENGIIISTKTWNTSGENVKELAIQIGTNLTTLQRLSLNFGSGLYGQDTIRDESVKELARQIGTNLNILQHLSINFSGCKHLTDESVKELAVQIGTNLKTFKTLKHLSLDFSCGTVDYYKITDRSVKELATQVSTNNLDTLQHLSLKFRLFKQITDQGVKEMAIKIGAKLKKIKYLGLTFGSCGQITDQSVNELAMQIGNNLKSLQHLSLDFSCPGSEPYIISDESLKRLATQIDTILETLRYLNLNFKDTCVSKPVKDDIFSQFKHLKEVKIQ